jgi:hypothetical protein
LKACLPTRFAEYVSPPVREHLLSSCGNLKNAAFPLKTKLPFRTPSINSSASRMGSMSHERVEEENRMVPCDRPLDNIEKRH